MRKLFSPRTGGIGLVALVVVVLPLFLPNIFYYDVAIHVGINAIVAIGLNLLIGYAGQISLGHAGFFGLGAYCSGLLAGVFGWHPVVALLAALVGVGVVAFIVARPILRLKGHYLAMATLGLGVLVAIFLRAETWLTGGPDGMIVPPFTVFGWTVAGEGTWYWVIGVLLVLSVWLALNIIDSPVGRALRAVHGSEVAAQMSGVDTTRYKVLVFVVSAVFAALMGAMTAFYSGFITPDLASFFHSIEFVTMVVVGGMASTFGAIVGAVILTLLPQFLTGFDEYEAVIFGAILMSTMIFLPRGLLPSLTRRLRKEG